LAWEYDAGHRMTAETGADGNNTSGQLVRSTTTRRARKKRPAPDVTTNTWDKAGNLVESSTALAGIIKWQLWHAEGKN